MERKSIKQPEMGDVWRHTSMCEIVIEKTFRGEDGRMMAKCVRDGLPGWGGWNIAVQTLPFCTIHKHYHYVGKFKGFNVVESVRDGEEVD